MCFTAVCNSVCECLFWLHQLLDACFIIRIANLILFDWVFQFWGVNFVNFSFWQNLGILTYVTVCVEKKTHPKDYVWLKWVLAGEKSVQ